MVRERRSSAYVADEVCPALYSIDGMATFVELGERVAHRYSICQPGGHRCAAAGSRGELM